MSYYPYMVFRNNDSEYHHHFEGTVSDPYINERVKKQDQLLHQTLIKIFPEDRLSSDQMEELICAPALTNQNFISMLILELEPSLKELFPKSNNFSLLWFAVLSCFQESAELLARSGADVNELYGSHNILKPRDLNEKSSLLHALLLMYPSAWNERFIGLLIERGANLEARDSNNYTLLHMAVINNRLRMAQLFLERGIDVNAGNDHDGDTALLMAARISDADLMVPLLIKYGADVTAKCRNGRNALHCLARAPCSAYREHAELARLLIEKGVSLDDRENVNQNQPIHEAIRKNEMVKILLDLGADVNARAKDNEFPLYIAAKNEDPAVLLTLLKRGANINLKTVKGCTALHNACLNSSLIDSEHSGENIRILLSNGADMFVENCEGKTPFSLMEHTEIENTRSMELMLKTLAIKKASMQPSIELKDEKIIKKYPFLWNYYQDCQAQISRAKSTRYAKTCAIFAFLTKCPCQIATFMRNSEFRTNIKTYDLKAFSNYARDIIEAFMHAEHYYDSMTKQEDLINEAVTGIFPHMIVTMMARYVLNCEICELKRIVHVSGQQ